MEKGYLYLIVRKPINDFCENYQENDFIKGLKDISHLLSLDGFLVKKLLIEDVEDVEKILNRPKNNSFEDNFLLYSLNFIESIFKSPVNKNCIYIEQSEMFLSEDRFEVYIRYLTRILDKGVNLALELKNQVLLDVIIYLVHEKVIDCDKIDIYFIDNFNNNSFNIKMNVNGILNNCSTGLFDRIEHYLNKI